SAAFLRQRSGGRRNLRPETRRISHRRGYARRTPRGQPHWGRHAVNGSKGKRGMFAQKPPTSPNIDPDVIKKLAGLLDETGLSEIEIEQDGARVRVARYGGEMMLP